MLLPGLPLSPYSLIQPGTSAQESHIKVMKWIHQTVTSNPKYSGNMHRVEGTCLPPGASPLNVQHYMYMFIYHPLIYHCISAHFQARIVTMFSNSVWQGECQTA